MGTSCLLSTRLEQVFSEIERITQASVSDLKSLDLSQYDGIISTVNLDIDPLFNGKPYYQIVISVMSHSF